MKRKRKRKEILLKTAYCLMLLVMFVLPFFSFVEYSLVRNSPSQLGAQNTPNAFIMNFTFAYLGLGSIIAGWRYYEGFAFQRLFLIVFGLSLAMAAFFNAAPVNNQIQFDLSEDGWHSYFISTARLSFFIIAVSSAFVLEKRPERLLAAGVGLSVIIFSIMNSEMPDTEGIWQRLFFIISFGWLVHCFKYSFLRNMQM